ncbi:Pentatricopeptide repeat [Dillenia turbinata]|uniref:Pentatricopeptide repeat n=1 Tax=Dillenia turbinata TaxID=194707 RepID=A0AAN8Z4C8_9MAGN
MASSLSIRHIRCLSTTITTTTTTSFSTISVSKAKSKLRSEHDPDKALEIYSSVSTHYTSPLSSRYTQDLTIKRLAKSKRFTDIESLLESHKKDPKITQEPFLSTLIRSYGLAGMLDHAIKTFDQMDELKTPRSATSFNALLSACNLSKEFGKVPKLFDEIPKKYGFLPDKVSYGILVKSYCESGKVESAMEILKEMEEKKIEVTNVTFTTVLDALYKKDMVDEAEKLWNEMVKRGCELDVAAYNVRIMYAHGSGPENVQALIDEMVAVGIKPDTIGYNYLMTSYCKSGKIDEAKKVYEDLENMGLHANAATYRTLVYYLCRNEDYERAYKVFKKSVEFHKIPDFGTLKFLVEGLVKKGNRKDAKGLIRTVKKKFPPSFLNAWKKVEVELGLVSESVSSDPVDVVQEATG